jgi:hypothetical protein
MEWYTHGLSQSGEVIMIEKWKAAYHNVWNQDIDIHILVTNYGRHEAPFGTPVAILPSKADAMWFACDLYVTIKPMPPEGEAFWGCKGLILNS